MIRKLLASLFRRAPAARCDAIAHTVRAVPSWPSGIDCASSSSGPLVSALAAAADEARALRLEIEACHAD